MRAGFMVRIRDAIEAMPSLDDLECATDLIGVLAVSVGLVVFGVLLLLGASPSETVGHVLAASFFVAVTLCFVLSAYCIVFIGATFVRLIIKYVRAIDAMAARAASPQPSNHRQRSHNRRR